MKQYSLNFDGKTHKTVIGGWHHDNANWQQRECPVCHTNFTLKSGASKYCSEKCKGKVQYITGRKSTENQYAAISGNRTRYFQRLACRSHKRFNLSYLDLLEVLEKQNNKCALTGRELTCTLKVGTKFGTNASIDRIEAGGLYIKENIQLVCAAINSFRTDKSIEEFVQWCTDVAKYKGKLHE